MQYIRSVLMYTIDCFIELLFIRTGLCFICTYTNYSVLEVDVFNTCPSDTWYR